MVLDLKTYDSIFFDWIQIQIVTVLATLLLKSEVSSWTCVTYTQSQTASQEDKFCTPLPPLSLFSFL